MINIEEYLKERNILTDSLEANSIREGAQWMKNKIAESLDKLITDDLEFDSDNWVEIVGFLEDALAEIQDIYEHNN